VLRYRFVLPQYFKETPMNTSVSPTQTTGSNKTLWAAIAVLGVAVLAMGATLIRIQSQPTEPRTAVLEHPTAVLASAPVSAPSSAPLAQASAPAMAPAMQKPPVNQAVAPHKPAVLTSNRTAAHTQQAHATTNSGANEVFLPSASPKPVRPQNPEPAVARPPEPVKAICETCGTVERVTPVDVPGTGSGTGAIAGGVLGAVVGNQIGDGTGKALATILGAVGGGMAGNAVEKKMNKVTHYEVTVRMDDGSHRVVRQTTPAPVGSQVTVNGDNLLPR
jgi:outer membrane lipoprotein SlyB